MSTKIGWVQNPDGTKGETWNVASGCTPVSEGCANCYAKRMATRLAGHYGYPADEPFRVTLHRDKLDEPLRWRKPRMVFCTSMGDLFHEDVPDEYIDQIMEIIYVTRRHTYQLLTKRPERMRAVLGAWHESCLVKRPFAELFPHVWGMVTAENQQRADERIPVLLRTPFAVRGVSLEPLLSGVRLPWLFRSGPPWLSQPQPMGARTTWETKHHGDPRIDWCVVGVETGPGRRPCKLEWIEDIVAQCRDAGVACFVKQIELNERISHDPAEWPEHLRVREWPR